MDLYGSLTDPSGRQSLWIPMDLYGSLTDASGCQRESAEVRELYEMMDADHNGALTRAEAARHFKRPGMHRDRRNPLQRTRTRTEYKLNR